MAEDTKQVVTIRLAPDDKMKLDGLRETTGESYTDIIRSWISQALDDQPEDIQELVGHRKAMTEISKELEGVKGRLDNLYTRLESLTPQSLDYDLLAQAQARQKEIRDLEKQRAESQKQAKARRERDAIAAKNKLQFAKDHPKLAAREKARAGK